MAWDKRLLLLFTISLTICLGRTQTVLRIVEEPADTVVGRHQPATLECRAEGTPPLKVQWFKDGEPLQGAGAASGPGSRRVVLPAGGLFFLRAAHARRDSDAGIYWCEVTNRFGTVRSRNATLQVAVLREEFKLEPVDTWGAAGETALLECSPPRGTPEPVVNWRKNGQIMDLEGNERISIVDGGNLIIQDMRQSDDGRYQCIAKNVAGTRESVVVHFRVHVKPYLISGPQDAVALAGGSVTFPCRVGGDPLPDVLWRRTAGGGNMPLGRVHILEDRALRLDSVAPEDEGEYSCEADNAVGAITATGILTVHSPPFLKVKPVAQSVEVGSEAFFECLAIGNPRPTLYWSLEGNHSLIFPGVSWDRYRTVMTLEGKVKLVLEASQKEDSGTTVVCSAINSAGSATGRAKLIVTSEEDRPPPVILWGPSNQTLPLKSIAEFPCSAVGNPDPTITWYHKSTLIIPSVKSDISDGGTLTVKNLDKDDSGTYTCMAFNKNGKYAWSAILKVDSPTNPSINFFRRPDTSALPGEPTRPQIRNQSESSVTISWSKNNKIGSSSLLGYQVEMFARGGGIEENVWAVVARHLQDTVHTQRLPAVGGSYVFLVRAENSHGLSPPSALSETVFAGGDNYVMYGLDEGAGTALMAEARASLQVDEVVRLTDIIAVESTVVKLAWETVNSHNVEGYYIYYRPLDAINTTVGEYSMQTILHSGSASGFSISNLKKHALYDFFLVPFNKNIDGKPSNSRKAKTLEDVPTEAPTHLEAFLLNSTSVYLKWQPPPVGTQNGVIQYYQVVVKEGANDSKLVHNVSVVGETVRLGGLVAGAAYWLKLAAGTSKGIGPYTQQAALRLPANMDPYSKILNHYLNRNTLDQNPQHVDSSDLLSEAWFLTLLVTMLTVMTIIFVGTYLFRRHRLLAKKIALPNLYDSRSTGTSLVTHLSLKSTPAHSRSMNARDAKWMTSTDGRIDGSGSWRPPTSDCALTLRETRTPDYAEVDPSTLMRRKCSLDETPAYASVAVMGGDRHIPGTLGWIQMCAGSKNKMNEDFDEEVYPASNGGYYNRNVYSDTYFSNDRPSLFKFENPQLVDGSNQQVVNANTNSRSIAETPRPMKERTYSLPQTPCSTIRRGHRLQLMRSQKNENSRINGDPLALDNFNTYHEIRTQENPTFGLVDDNCRLSDFPDDTEKQYFAHVPQMKLLNHHYSRPEVTRHSPTGKNSALFNFSTVKSPNGGLKSEYHTSSRSEPGNH